MSFWIVRHILFVRHAAALTASPVALFHHPHQCGGLRRANHKATKMQKERLEMPKEKEKTKVFLG